MKHKFFYNVNGEKKLPTHGHEWLKSLFHLDSGTKQRGKKPALMLKYLARSD